MREIINPEYIIESKTVARPYNRDYLVVEHLLIEESYNSNNKVIFFESTPENNVLVFHSDFKRNDQPQNPLVIFNPIHTLGLRKIPDYLVFYQSGQIVYVIIVELKSKTIRSGGLTNKFRNGLNIANFIVNSYNSMNKNLNLKVKSLKLLFRLPYRNRITTKQPVSWQQKITYNKELGCHECTSDRIKLRDIRLDKFR